MSKSKLIKNKCEIESCNIMDANLLELHHIIERTELNTTNHDYNLAILCANHHSMIHTGRLKIIGVYPATQPPNGRILIYELDEKKNIDGIDAPIVEFRPSAYKIFNGER